MKIYCCGCKKEVNARLTNGDEIYRNRKGRLFLAFTPFWKCDKCKNYVGIHKNSKYKKPLGVIPTQQIRRARQFIHKELDSLWQEGHFKRREIYEKISKELGYKYHTAWLKDIEEARKVYKIILKIKKGIEDENNTQKRV
jgi:hypothetical protein